MNWKQLHMNHGRERKGTRIKLLREKNKKIHPLKLFSNLKQNVNFQIFLLLQGTWISLSIDKSFDCQHAENIYFNHILIIYFYFNDYLNRLFWLLTLLIDIFNIKWLYFLFHCHILKLNWNFDNNSFMFNIHTWFLHVKMAA